MSRNVPSCPVLSLALPDLYLLSIHAGAEGAAPHTTADRKDCGDSRFRNDRGSEVLGLQTEELRVLPPPQWVARFFILTIFSLWLSCVCPLYDSIRGSYGVRRF